MMQEKYKKEVVPLLKKQFGFKSNLDAPKIIKVVINSGVGSRFDQKQIEATEKSLALIAGQKPALRAAKKAIASFKTRQGQTVGVAVTLRGRRMYDFLDRMIQVAIPRMRDFRGIDPKSIDGRGNLNLGFKEHIVFPEIVGEDVKDVFGLQVTVVVNARNREGAIELFKLMGFPFSKK